MKLRTVRLGVLLAALLGLLATTTPAQATTIKLIAFTGNADLSTGLGYPCAAPTGTTGCTTATTTVKTGPKNEPQVNVTPGGNTAGFSFRSEVCVKTSVSSIDKANPKTSPADICVIQASGTVSGFCGLSTGMGVATITNPTKNPQTISSDIKFTGIGGVLHVSGGNKATNVYAEVSAIPNPSTPITPAGSCTTNTATTFILTGVAVYKNCTGQVNNTGVCDPT